MFGTKKAPMINFNNQVQTTTNYSMFTPIDGNRTLNELHKNRLRKSMEQNYLFTVIIVNEKKEIIDGQHRFTCIKELDLPLHYIVCEGYGIKEVHILNENNKTWNMDDYLDGYCKLGYDDYILYKSFKDKYKFNHNVCISLLSKVFNKRYFQDFSKGLFKVENYKKGCEIADCLMRIAPFYKGYSRREFVSVIISLIKNNKKFDFDHFLTKVKKQPTSLVDCTTQDSYRMLIEDIYNYKSRDKVNLRY
jgi:hypothetical protein